MKNKASKPKMDFSLPENYFADFNKRLDRKIEISETIPKATGFVVPDGYLNEFDKRLADKIIKTHAARKQSKLRVLYTIGSVAAAIILGFILIKPGNSMAIEQQETLTTFDIDAYIEEGFMNLNTYDIIETFHGVSLEEIQMSEPIPREEIIEYLNQNNIDNYTLTVE